MELKAVFFDFGGTIDLYPVNREHALKSFEKMRTILKRKGVDLTAKYTIEEFYKLINVRLGLYGKWKKKNLIELSGLQMWKKYLLHDEPEINGLDDGTAEELAFLIETGRFIRSARPEMKDTMELLIKTGLHFGIISNVVSLTQVPVNLIDYGLESYFSQVVLSSEFGMVKPDISIFHHAAKEAGFEPGECIYVGNSPSKDVTGAKNAGFMGAVQIEYVDDSDDTTDPGIEPDFFIKSMTELPDIVSYYQKNGSNALG